MVCLLFAEVSALAYHDGTKAKKELKAIGFNSYKFLENDGALMSHIQQ